MLIGILLFSAVLPIFAQTENRSYYVRADGDDNNNGRSEDSPFRTLSKALDMATKGAVKKITIIGTLTEKEFIMERFKDIAFGFRKLGSSEILVTGKKDASEEERAILTSTMGKNAIIVDVSANVKFEYLEIRGVDKHDSGLQIRSGKVTIGNGVKICNCDSGIYLNKEISNEACVLTLAGGEISNNLGTGIGVSNGATFNMESGVIRNNETGGVIVYDSTFILSGGEISNNGKPSTIEGEGGISFHKYYYNDRGDFSMTGGLVTGNTGKLGGGISFYADSPNYSLSISVSGGEITHNTSKMGGGIYIANSRTKLTIENAKISNNKAEYGAGVYNTGAFLFKSGQIMNNEAEYVGGGVYLKEGSTFTNTSGILKNNTAGDGEGQDIFKQ